MIPSGLGRAGYQNTNGNLSILSEIGRDIPFVGAYDAIPSIYAAYGLRRLRSAYTGNLVRLRRVSDSVESDFTSRIDGNLDIAAIISWLAGSTATVVTWYDQSGSARNIGQATTTKQPVYTESVQNSRPGFLFDGVDDALFSATIATTAAYSFLAAYRQDTPLGVVTPGVLALSGANIGWTYTCTNARVRRIVHQALFIATDATFTAGTPEIASLTHASGAAPVLWVNAASQTLTGGLTTFNTGDGLIQLSNNSIAAQVSKGYMYEVVVANAGWSTGDRQAAESAANAYWAIY